MFRCKFAFKGWFFSFFFESPPYPKMLTTKKMTKRTERLARKKEIIDGARFYFASKIGVFTHIERAFPLKGGVRRLLVLVNEKLLHMLDGLPVDFDFDVPDPQIMALAEIFDSLPSG